MPSHLLIVDDSEPVRTSLRALLGIAAGIASIREAATLRQALDSARQDPPTLVILDMSLPDGRAWTVLLLSSGAVFLTQFQLPWIPTPVVRSQMANIVTRGDIRREFRKDQWSKGYGFITWSAGHSGGDEAWKSF
jgi:DNA-binding NarL/FixJ family response regulator